MLPVLDRIEPDAILLDIMMPDLDGYDVCKAVRQRPGHQPPILFLSALTESYDKAKAFEVGGQDYITKPIYPEEVVARLDSQIKRAEETHRLSDEIVEKEQELKELSRGARSDVAPPVRLRDNETGNHIERVQDLSTLFAQLCCSIVIGCLPLFVEGIRLAAPLHDIGKIAVPDSILLKTDKLSVRNGRSCKTTSVSAGKCFRSCSAIPEQLFHPNGV